jgi:hypothetical protein
MAPTRTLMEQGMRGTSRTHLRGTAVTLLPTLHKQVPAHRAAHQPVGVWGVGHAGGVRLLHEGLQVTLAAPAEYPGKYGAEGRGVTVREEPLATSLPTCPAPDTSPEAARHDAAAAH